MPTLITSLLLHQSGEMPALCMQQAIDDAGMKPEDVDYINAHGTSTHRNDLNETLAAKKVFGLIMLIK